MKTKRKEKEKKKKKRKEKKKGEEKKVLHSFELGPFGAQGESFTTGPRGTNTTLWNFYY